MATPRHVSEFGLERFQDDRFGMLVHWDLYSLIGANEWVMFHERYSAEEDERLATRFEAAAFDADALVRLAADAGQRFARDVHHFRPVSELAQVLVRSAAGTAAATLLHDGGPAMSRDDQIRHGILLFEGLVDMASGTPSKSEVLGFGAEEIVPWRMGAVM
jgi:hypothetical protein